MSGLRMVYLGLAGLGLAQFAGLALQAGSVTEAWRLVWGVSAVLPWGAGAWAAGAALAVWAGAEIWVRRNWVALVAIPAAFCAGLGCGLPLYLFLRTRPVG